MGFRELLAAILASLSASSFPLIPQCSVLESNKIAYTNSSPMVYLFVENMTPGRASVFYKISLILNPPLKRKS